MGARRGGSQFVAISSRIMGTAFQSALWKVLMEVHTVGYKSGPCNYNRTEEVKLNANNPIRSADHRLPVSFFFGSAS